MNSGTGRRLAGVLAAVGMTLAGAASVGSAVPICLQASLPCPAPVELSAKRIRVSPQTLPRGRKVPIAFSGGARISSGDGSHPPALREATLRVDRRVDLDAVGLPVCSGGSRDIGSRDSEGVKKMCRSAIVGSGTARIELAYFESTPIAVESELVLINGGIDRGTTTLFVHAFVPTPVPRAVVARVEISRERKGRFGWLVQVAIPVIGGGGGSLLGFNLTAWRRFFADGQRKSFLSARCPDGRFQLEVSEAVFRNESQIPGVAPRTVLKGSLLAPCMPTRGRPAKG